MSIKVFLVDDSPFMRKVFIDIISGIPDVEVIGTSRSGKDTIRRFAQIKPDLILMDVEMPGINGFEALKMIKEKSSVRVIMMSAEGGEDITIKALQSGADDFIPKPENLKMPREEFKNNLEERIKALFQPTAPKKAKPVKKDYAPKRRILKKAEFPFMEVPEKIKAIAIGSSTGGPRALMHVIGELPKELTVPIFIVQHMPAGFTASFAKRLNNGSKVTVVEAVDGLPVEKGIVYVAPGNQHMIVEKQQIRLLSTPKIHGVRPAVDILFESVAKAYGAGTVGTVLTGMGNDGAEGLYQIKTAGGYSLAQNEETSVVYGMPKSAVDKGVVDECISLQEISERLNQMIKVSK